MRFRLKAFSLHLAGSLCALSLVLGTLYLGWYRWPGWYLTDATHVTGLVLLVDAALGPFLTLVIATAAKPGRVLARDVAVIVTVQLAALVYGAATLWQGRPLYYAFSVDRVELVQASDVKPKEAALARKQNPALAPSWLQRPRWVWAPLPDDPAEATKIVNGAVFGGDDVIDMPRYFKPWSRGTPELRKRLKKVDQLVLFNKTQRRRLKERMAARGLPTDQPVSIMMTGRGAPVLAVFDPGTLQLKAMLRAD